MTYYGIVEAELLIQRQSQTNRGPGPRTPLNIVPRSAQPGPVRYCFLQTTNKT